MIRFQTTRRPRVISLLCLSRTQALPMPPCLSEINIIAVMSYAAEDRREVVSASVEHREATLAPPDGGAGDLDRLAAFDAGLRRDGLSVIELPMVLLVAVDARLVAALGLRLHATSSPPCAAALRRAHGRA